MKRPSFLAFGQTVSQGTARAAAWAILPLAALCLAPPSAQAVSSPRGFNAQSPTFNSSNVQGSPFTLAVNGASSGAGASANNSLESNSVGSTKSYGTQAFLVDGGIADSTGMLDPASVVSGTTFGVNHAFQSGLVIPFSAEFSITDPVNLTFDSWTLTFDLGSSSASISGLFYNNAAAETGDLTVATSQMNPAYSADLRINATQIASGPASFTLVIPQNSINFNTSVTDLVPEPGAWALLWTGGAGLLVVVLLKRRQPGVRDCYFER